MKNNGVIDFLSTYFACLSAWFFVNLLVSNKHKNCQTDWAQNFWGNLLSHGSSSQIFPEKNFEKNPEFENDYSGDFDEFKLKILLMIVINHKIIFIFRFGSETNGRIRSYIWQKEVLFCWSLCQETTYSIFFVCFENQLPIFSLSVCLSGYPINDWTVGFYVNKTLRVYL